MPIVRNPMALRILALEPYYGGSHQAFLDGWMAHSGHQFTLLTLPAFHWKWRMRHAAITLAHQINQQAAEGQQWDLVFASDMLNLAELRGLVTDEVARLPSVLYFHENQLTYPAQQPREWDYHFAFSNFVSGLSASQSWFNSSFHRLDFLSALADFLQRMPDHQPLEQVARIEANSQVQWPGVDLPPRSLEERADGPLRICWAARWEHDKAPGILQQALLQLVQQGVEFRISVLGESFRNSPEEFDQMRSQLAERIDQWGFLPSRADYQQALAAADVFVSTAAHEFFGISVVEAIAAGAYPLVPRRLAYPDVLTLDDHPEREIFFYDGSSDELANRLAQLAQTTTEVRREPLLESLRASMERYSWPLRAAAMDQQLVQLIASAN